jgi:hypothetical protein
MIGISVAYLILLIIIVLIEDKIEGGQGFDKQYLNILQLCIMVFYLIDTLLTILAYGIKDHLWHFVRFFEFLLVIAIFVISIIELD